VQLFHLVVAYRCILVVVRVELRDSVALVLGVWEWGEGPSHFVFPFALSVTLSIASP